MDELNSQFGRLSTNAAEFRPGSGVEEFVPGQGWKTATRTTTSSTSRTTSSTTAANIGITVPQQSPTIPSEPTQFMGSAAAASSTLPAAVTPPPLPTFRALHSLGLPEDDLWRHYREWANEANRQMEPNDQRHKAVPVPFCNAYCLDATTMASSRRNSFGYPSNTFQVTSREDGHLYVIKRFDNVKSVSPKIATAVAERWTAIDHPGIVPLYQCFVAQRAVFFVYHYIPGARTLRERCFSAPLSEAALWSCTTQLVAALQHVHATQNLAVRSLRLQHIISQTDSTATRLRLRINCVGIIDALEYETRKNIQDLQREDIRDLGRLLVSLATGTEITAATDPETMEKCERFMANVLSRDMVNFAMALIHRPPTIGEVSRAMGQKAFEEQTTAYRALDRTEAALAAEYESGRVLRLLLKLGFINERPEFGPNRRWVQSGDCYILTLFRDYVFHQADGAGNPVMDLGHVITALNKLDAADEEKIVLASRDGKSLMVVSYADVARCLENAFAELCAGAVHPSSLRY